MIALALSALTIVGLTLVNQPKFNAFTGIPDIYVYKSSHPFVINETDAEFTYQLCPLEKELCESSIAINTITSKIKISHTIICLSKSRYFQIVNIDDSNTSFIDENCIFRSTIHGEIVFDAYLLSDWNNLLLSTKIESILPLLCYKLEMANQDFLYNHHVLSFIMTSDVFERSPSINYLYNYCNIKETFLYTLNRDMSIDSANSLDSKCILLQYNIPLPFMHTLSNTSYYCLEDLLTHLVIYLQSEYKNPNKNLESVYFKNIHRIANKNSHMGDYSYDQPLFSCDYHEDDCSYYHIRYLSSIGIEHITSSSLSDFSHFGDEGELDSITTKHFYHIVTAIKSMQVAVEQVIANTAIACANRSCASHDSSHTGFKGVKLHIASLWRGIIEDSRDSNEKFSNVFDHLSLIFTAAISSKWNIAFASFSQEWSALLKNISLTTPSLQDKDTGTLGRSEHLLLYYQLLRALKSYLSSAEAGSAHDISSSATSLPYTPYMFKVCQTRVGTVTSRDNHTPFTPPYICLSRLARHQVGMWLKDNIRSIQSFQNIYSSFASISDLLVGGGSIGARSRGVGDARDNDNSKDCGARNVFNSSESHVQKLLINPLRVMNTAIGIMVSVLPSHQLQAEELCHNIIRNTAINRMGIRFLVVPISYTMDYHYELSAISPDSSRSPASSTSTSTTRIPSFRLTLLNAKRWLQRFAAQKDILIVLSGIEALQALNPSQLKQSIFAIQEYVKFPTLRLNHALSFAAQHVIPSGGTSPVADPRAFVGTVHAVDSMIKSLSRQPKWSLGDESDVLTCIQDYITLGQYHLNPSSIDHTYSYFDFRTSGQNNFTLTPFDLIAANKFITEVSRINNRQTLDVRYSLAKCIIALVRYNT